MSQPLIVGAGPSGLVAAIELARRGIVPRIIDSAPDFASESRAVGVNPRTLRILEACGATPRLLAEGTRIERSNLRFSKGRAATIDITRVGGAYPFMLALPQSRTERILADVLGQLGVAVEHDTEFKDFKEGSGRLHCRVEGVKGSRTFDTPLLIGADGAHSAVREAAQIPFPGDQLENDWFLADVRVAWPYPENELNIFITRDRFLFAITLGQGLWRFVSDHADPQTLLPADAKITETVWESAFRIHHRLVPSYQRGPVFLAGDAAHVHSPLGARGMNMGIEDAATLAWLVSTGREAQYHGLRHPIAKKVIATVKRQTLQAESHNRLTNAIAPWVGPAALKIGWINDFAARFVTGLSEPRPPWLTTV